MNPSNLMVYIFVSTTHTKISLSQYNILYWWQHCLWLLASLTCYCLFCIWNDTIIDQNISFTMVDKILQYIAALLGLSKNPSRIARQSTYPTSHKAPFTCKSCLILTRAFLCHKSNNHTAAIGQYYLTRQIVWNWWITNVFTVLEHSLFNSSKTIGYVRHLYTLASAHGNC